MNPQAFKLTSAILRGEWAIDPLYALQHLSYVENMLDGQKALDTEDEDADKEPTPVASLFVFDGGQWRASLQGDSPKLQGVELMRIEGPMFKYGNCGFGTVDYTEALMAGYRNSRVAATVISWDSPGGQINGIPSLHDAIRNPAKPTVSRIDEGMMASAAVWGACGSDYIVASQPTDLVGSIGVYTTLRDARDLYKRLGVNITDVYSTRSTQKNIEYRRALEGDLAPLRARLDKSADTFIATVKAARGAKLTSNEWAEGGIFTSEEGIKMGLIDDMGSLQEAFDLAYDIALVRKKKSFSNPSTKPTNMGLVDRARAYITGASANPTTENENPRDTALEALAAVAEERQTQLTALQGQLSTAQNELATTRTELTTANTELASLRTQVATLTTERNNWKEKAETYGAQPGAEPTKAGSVQKAEGESAPEKPKPDSFAKVAADYGL